MSTAGTVWVSTVRRGITAHDPNGKPLGVLKSPMTVCQRSMRTGTTITDQAAQLLEVIRCAKCWPGTGAA